MLVLAFIVCCAEAKKLVLIIEDNRSRKGLNWSISRHKQYFYVQNLFVQPSLSSRHHDGAYGTFEPPKEKS